MRRAQVRDVHCEFGELGDREDVVDGVGAGEAAEPADIAGGEDLCPEGFPAAVASWVGFVHSGERTAEQCSAFFLWITWVVIRCVAHRAALSPL